MEASSSEGVETAHDLDRSAELLACITHSLDPSAISTSTRNFPPPPQN